MIANTFLALGLSTFGFVCWVSGVQYGMVSVWRNWIKAEFKIEVTRKEAREIIRGDTNLVEMIASKK